MDFTQPAPQISPLRTNSQLAHSTHYPLPLLMHVAHTLLTDHTLSPHPPTPPHTPQTYHCHTPRKLTASQMDPSCTIGFLCPSLKDFISLRKNAEKVLAPPLQKGVYPFFSFSDQCLSDVLDVSVNTHIFCEDPVKGMEFMDGEEGSLHRPRGSHLGWRKGEGLEGIVFSDEEDFVVVDCNPSTNVDSVPSHDMGKQESSSRNSFLTNDDF